jgi:hypothetical protein
MDPVQTFCMHMNKQAGYWKHLLIDGVYFMAPMELGFSYWKNSSKYSVTNRPIAIMISEIRKSVLKDNNVSLISARNVPVCAEKQRRLYREAN